MKVITRAQAKQAGLKTYFTGNPCKHGHVSERRISGQCIECELDYKKRHYSAHAEIIKRRVMEAYYRDPEKVRKRVREYEKNNPDKTKAARKSWADRNREKIRENSNRRLELP